MTAKDLKNALLQEAVQGKLVPQIKSEGNAKDLLEEIKKEKAKLIKEGKLKKEKPLPEITDDEIPFDIPENWCWCRLGELVQFKSGNQYEESNSGTLYVKVADMNLLDNSIEIITSSRYTNCTDESFIPINSIIFPKRGGAILTNKKRLVLKSEIFVDSNTMGITPFIKSILDYLTIWFDNVDLGKLASGTSVPQINNKDLIPLLFPLPPLAEQKRIVAAIEHFMPLIDEYGKKEAELTALNANIAKTLKNAILQEAVQGKLALQIANEGNAKDLLEEIKKEKAKLIKEGKLKKEKPLPEISEDEIPFDIPENWCWCRLNEIVSILGDGIHGTPNYDIKGEYYFINGNNLSDGNIVIKEDTKRVNEEEYQKYKKELNENTVFVSINGTLGNIAFYNNEKIILGKSACYFNLLKNEMKSFIYWIIKTTYFLDYATQEATGTTIKNVSLATMRNLPIPLPPLDEQKQIVGTIEKMLPLCEKLGD